MAEANALGSKQWEELVGMSPLQPGYADQCRHFFAVSSTTKVQPSSVNRHMYMYIHIYMYIYMYVYTYMIYIHI